MISNLNVNSLLQASINEKWVGQKLQYFQTVDDFKLEEETPNINVSSIDSPIVVRTNTTSNSKVSLSPEVVAEYEEYKRALGELEPHSIEEFVLERSSSLLEAIVDL